jgi:hypothetical protein
MPWWPEKPKPLAPRIRATNAAATATYAAKAIQIMNRVRRRPFGKENCSYPERNGGVTVRI